MKSTTTGLVRRVDALGRIVLPIELRRALHIDVRDMLEISVVDGQIVLRVCKPSCVFCESREQLSQFEGKSVCRACIRKLQKAE